MTRPITRAAVVDSLEQLAQYGVPSASAVRLLDVGSEQFLSYFEREVLDQLVGRGGATCKLFEGAYGSGKTHLLQLLEASALDRGMAVVRTDLSQALSLEDWQLVTQHILRNISCRVGGVVVTSLPRVLDALARSGGIDANALHRRPLPHPGFARAMALLFNPSVAPAGRRLLDRYLTGERVGVGDLKFSGVTGVKQPLSSRNAEQVLKTVLAGLFRLGVPGTLLLFDESEKTFTFSRALPPKRIVLGANLLRRLIDASATGSLVATAVVFAVLPGFVQSCALAYPALGQRLNVGSGAPRGWRSPVVPLDAIAADATPDGFLEALVARLETVLSECGTTLNGNRQSLLNAGREVLSKHAGSGYRRHLVKQIAALAVQQL